MTITTYISKEEPSWAVDKEYYPGLDFSFLVAETGDWYEDDYTRVEVTPTQIIYTKKE